MRPRRRHEDLERRCRIGDAFVLGYLDAGTGSLVLQVVAASLVSACVVFGGIWTQVRRFVSVVLFRRLSETPADSAASPNIEETAAVDGHRSVTDRVDVASTGRKAA